MGGLRAGLVVLVRFPFSDLSSSKLRPALVLAPAGGTDWVLCQITSNQYGRHVPVSAAALRSQGKNGFVIQDSLGEWDFRPLLARIQVPTLVVEGADTTVLLDATREWVATLPNGRLLLVPGAGHMPFVEQPEAFFGPVIEFLRGSWAIGGSQVSEGREVSNDALKLTAPGCVRVGPGAPRFNAGFDGQERDPKGGRC